MHYLACSIDKAGKKESSYQSEISGSVSRQTTCIAVLVAMIICPDAVKSASVKTNKETFETNLESGSENLGYHSDEPRTARHYSYGFTLSLDETNESRKSLINLLLLLQCPLNPVFRSNTAVGNLIRDLTAGGGVQQVARRFPSPWPVLGP
ncbi:immunoglobulin superfamily member 5 isoform X1 [Prionailurus iriomotensis]